MSRRNGTGSRPNASYSPPPARLTRRSGVTNAKRLFIELRDDNSLWARRLRDLMALQLNDLGGSENCSEAEKALVRRASMLILQCELLEQKWAKNGGEASERSLNSYQRISGGLRRILESLGLQRRAKDVTPEDFYEVTLPAMAARNLKTPPPDDDDAIEPEPEHEADDGVIG